ncbi:MAG: hypothetical protein HQL53_07795 [Magnetococcales bacterium]|nr:hypothetical protein [Magnetococcales bacterium]
MPIQPSFTGGELTPSLHSRVDLSKYNTGLKTCKNFFVHAHGGVSNCPGMEFLNRAMNSTHAVRLIPFQFNTEQTYVLEFGELYMRVFMDGGPVLEANQSITGITQASPGVVTIAGHGFVNGDWVWVDSVAGMTEMNGYYRKVANVSSNTFTLTDLDDNAIDTSNYSAYSSGGTAARVYTVTSPYAASDLALVKYTQTADTMTLVHPSYEPRTLTRSGHTTWSFAGITYNPEISAPTGVSGSGGIGDSYSYKVTAISETGEESLPSAASSGTLNEDGGTLTWTAVSGAARYVVYKNKPANGIYGFAGLAGSNTWTDTVINPDLSDTIPNADTPFNGTDNYPGTVTYFEQRGVYGATNNRPQTIFMTQVGNYHNFNTSSPTRDDDAIVFTH